MAVVGPACYDSAGSFDDKSLVRCCSDSSGMTLSRADLALFFNRVRSVRQRKVTPLVA